MFTKRISTEIEFDGTRDEVWRVLTDFTRYPEWNPGFVSVQGVAEAGTKLHVTFAKEGGKGMTMHPTVQVADPGRELRWLGRLFIPWVFDGEHRYEIVDAGPGRVRVTQSERFAGVLVPFLRTLINVDTVSMFGRINRALADRVATVGNAA